MNLLGRELERVARGQHGVVLSADLRRLGVDREGLAAATRQLFRLRRGAYALEEPSDRVERHKLEARAVALQHGHEVVLSHTTAALFHGLSVLADDLDFVHLTAQPSKIRVGCRHGVHSHSGLLSAHERCLRSDLVVTAPLRTVLDSALVLPLESAVVIADQALHQQMITYGELTTGVEGMPRKPRISVARRMAELADAAAESPGESRTRLILQHADIAVTPQFVVAGDDGSFIGRVDLKLRDFPVVVEFDGRAKYRLQGDAEAAHWKEKQRQDELLDAGYLVVRVTWRDLCEPTDVLRKVFGAISRARRMGPGTCA